MIILSHRGAWQSSEEKNSINAFHRSFQLSFGTETDIRDYKGELVISHDIPNENNITLQEFLEIYNQYDKFLPLALNIKADGLQDKLKVLFEQYNIENYFVFDMSVPDGMIYVKEKLTAFTRHSEYENPPAYYEFANGVWLDQFNNDWITEEVIIHHLKNRKKICIVSPELHKRNNKQFWEKLKAMRSQIDTSEIMLCTDYPEEARMYFDD